MSITVVNQFGLLSVIVAVGVCIVYFILNAIASLEKVQRGLLEEMRDHLDWREEQIAALVQDISDNLQKLDDRHSTVAERKDDTSNGNGNGHFIRLRKELVAMDPESRFSVLNDWVNANYLSFLRRASNGGYTPAHLISHIPAYFEAQAEISPDNFLLISTRGYPEKVAVRLDEADAFTADIIAS
jgi:hypothetical protein